MPSSPSRGERLGITATPFVSDCDYDQAKAILAWIYGPLTPAEGPPKGRFIVFDQQPFSEPGDGFADEGVVYVPPSCTERPGCRVHIALHGCEQSREAVGDDFIKESGYAEIADANRLVILFPQAKSITGINPKAAGIGGAIRASTISARTRPRSQRSGPWSSISPRGLDGHARGRRHQDRRGNGPRERRSVLGNLSGQSGHCFRLGTERLRQSMHVPAIRHRSVAKTACTHKPAAKC